jgi:hypothetical protein
MQQAGEIRRTFVAGAEGEVLVEQRLRALADCGWKYRSNLPKPDGGDIDHVLWGPRGVFVIETKALRGRVTVEAGRLTFDRSMPNRDPVHQAYANALVIRDYLTKPLGRRVWVVSVLSLTEAFIENYRIDMTSPPVHVVKMERLLALIENYDNARPLATQTVQRISEAIRDPRLRPAYDPTPTPCRDRPSVRPRECGPVWKPRPRVSRQVGTRAGAHWAEAADKRTQQNSFFREFGGFRRIMEFAMPDASRAARSELLRGDNPHGSTN